MVMGLNLKTIHCIRVLLALAFVVFMAFPSYAADSYRVNNGVTSVIDEHGICRVVTNTSGQPLFVPTRTSAEWTAFYNNPPGGVSTPPCASCDLDGASVPHGGSRAFYMTTRSCYGTCASISQTRNCYNGVLDGSASYSKANCPAPTCSGCTTSAVTWNTSSFICNGSATAGSHGQVRNLTDSTAPNVGSASYECDDGTWNQASGSCGGASCALPWGGSVNHSQSVTAYQNSSEPCGGSCTSELRSCNNGSLSGSYVNQSCSVSLCSSCTLPWGGSIAHNGSVTAYASSTVPCGSSCSSQTRSCNDGTLSGSYGAQSCSATSCSGCSLPWGGSIAHNASVTAYSSSSVSCGSSCSSQTRSCNNGSLSGSYGYGSCSVAGCSNCSLDGVTVAHNASRVFYQSSRSCGQSCTAIDASRTCNNGTLSGSSSYNKQSCPAETCSSCSLPWGGTIGHNSSVTAYQNSTVPCGSSCSSQTRSCSNGSLSGSYANSSCSVDSCAPACQWVEDFMAYCTMQCSMPVVAGGGDCPGFGADCSACAGCTSFPATSICTAGADCSGAAHPNCLKDQVSCSSGQVPGNDTVCWTRMRCVCN